MKFKIKAGKHFHSNFFSRFNLLAFGKINYKIRFGNGCWHPKPFGWKRGLNKLVGISYYDNHRTSARVVWEPDFDRPGRIKLLAYVYDNTIRKPAIYLTSVFVEETFSVSVQSKKGFYKFNVKGVEYLFPVEYPKGFFKQWPYFGGKETAPNDMEIFISKNK